MDIKKDGKPGILLRRNDATTQVDVPLASAEEETLYKDRLWRALHL